MKENYTGEGSIRTYMNYTSYNAILKNAIDKKNSTNFAVSVPDVHHENHNQIYGVHRL